MLTGQSTSQLWNGFPIPSNPPAGAAAGTPGAANGSTADIPGTDAPATVGGAVADAPRGDFGDGDRAGAGAFSDESAGSEVPGAAVSAPSSTATGSQRPPVSIMLVVLALLVLVGR